MPLPTAPSSQELRPDRLRALIYGSPGAGKTRFVSGWYPNTNLIIDMEGGTRFLPGEHFIVRPSNYTEFNQVVTELVSGQHQFTTVTIDTIDALVNKADAEAGIRHGKVAAGLAEFGKGLADRDGTIRRDIDRLLSSDMGVLLTSHSEAVDDEESGTRVFHPSVDKRLRPFFEGAVDFLWFARKNGPARELICQPNSKFEVKSRVPVPDSIPLDPAAARDAVKAACNQITNNKEK